MKKLIILLLLILASTAQAQTKKKITELTADATPTADDIVEVTNNPGGTPASRKVTIGNFTKGLVAASTTDKESGLGTATFVFDSIVQFVNNGNSQLEFQTLGGTRLLTLSNTIDATVFNEQGRERFCRCNRMDCIRQGG